MEKQEMEMKQKLEMEYGNGNWKQKWEKKITGVCFLYSVLDGHYSCVIYLAMVIGLAL